MMYGIVQVRASGLWALFDCPARWAAIYLDGRTLPATRPAWIGTSLHHATALYDAARLAGNQFDVSDAADAFVEKLHHPDEDVDWGTEPRSNAERIGLALLTRYCLDVSQTQEWLHVELELQPLQIEFDNGITLELTGTADRVRRTADGRLGGADIKSGERAVSRDGRARTQGHGIQMGVYELLIERTLGAQLDAPFQIIGLQTTNNYRIGTGEIVRPKDALIGRAGQKGLLEHAADMLGSGLFYGNGHSILCSPQYCPIWASCHFRL